MVQTDSKVMPAGVRCISRFEHIPGFAVCPKAENFFSVAMSVQ